jgi:type VI protein secretion system component VasK
MPTPDDDTSTELTGARYWVTWILAVALLVLFALSCWLLFRLADDTGVDEKVWARYLYVFGALQAIVFTAVGWIFDREVHRSAAEAATKDAKRAKQEAKDAANEAKQEAVRGHALAEAVKASVGALGGLDRIGAASSETTSMPSQLISLKQMADKLYP